MNERPDPFLDAVFAFQLRLGPRYRVAPDYAGFCATVEYASGRGKPIKVSAEALLDRPDELINYIRRFLEWKAAEKEQLPMIPSSCRSCGAPIVWATTEAGRLSPLDFHDVPDGNVIVDRVESGPAGDIVHVRTLKKGEETEALRYVSHFATCPNAKQHNRRS